MAVRSQDLPNAPMIAPGGGPGRPRVARPSTALEMAGRFGQDTASAFYDAHNEPLRRGRAAWTTGNPIIDAGIQSFRSGVWFLGGVENCGKSNFSNCLEMGVLRNTPGSLVIDFIIDDNRETRMHQLAAAEGRLPMDLVTIPALMDKNDPRREVRRRAYRSLAEDYRGRLEIVDPACWNDRGAYLEDMFAYLRAVRKAHPLRPIWVTLDAFDDPVLPKGIREEERVIYTSGALKALCNELGDTAPFAVLAIKHLNKFNRGRWTSGDSLRGSGKLLYDAKIVTLAYSEMGELGAAAQVSFNPDPKDPSARSPIFELFFQKNKVGSLKGKRVYFYQFPESYFCSECVPEDQEFYGAMVSDSAGVQKVLGGKGK